VRKITSRESGIDVSKRSSGIKTKNIQKQTEKVALVAPEALVQMHHIL
jgi:hypothetical protein